MCQARRMSNVVQEELACEAQARRKAKPRVPAYHETILDLTECSLFDAVLRCADMWDELDRADRRKRMN